MASHHKQGSMLVSNAERLQIATQRHEINQQIMRDLLQKRKAIGCRHRAPCWERPQQPPEQDCEPCSRAWRLLYLIEKEKQALRVSADYLRKAKKRAKGSAK